MRIELLGTAFEIRSSDDPERLERVVALVRRKLDGLRRSVKSNDPLKLAILVSLSLADDVLRHSPPAVPESEDPGIIAQRIIDTLDKTVKDQV